MGLASSKFSGFGSLVGAYAPPLPGVELPPKLDPEVKTYAATVPAGKGGGDKMTLNLKGHDVTITIPRTLIKADGSSRRIKPGDKFAFKWGFREKVIASTLPSLPGSYVVQAKPMIYSNVSDAFFEHGMNDQREQTSMSRRLAPLMQEAQSCLLQQAVELGCNAVLSINMNISTDSSGDRGNSKIVIVTFVGTPCVVMPLDTLPVIEAHATLEPEMLY